jgi:DNA-directed RNA polymerase I subunit RPA49
MADRTEKEKKRKRHPDGTSKPSKRVAIEGDKQVKISLHEADKWAPVIGMYFSSRASERREALRLPS